MNILLVKQNAKLTFEATTHCFVMENGEIVMDGPANEASNLSGQVGWRC
jgi:branched-chain amino acid transport system ATP-binding protein